MSETSYSLCEIPPFLTSRWNAMEDMLRKNGLEPAADLELYIGVCDGEGNIVGGGGIAGNVIKCVVLDSSLRGEGITNSLITRLRQEARQRGHRNIFIYTKPENEETFSSLAFHTIARAPKAVMLESDPRGISGYCRYLKTLRKPGRNGAIVMNCNPLTSGHLHLIRTAAASCDNLYILPVATDASEFSYQSRLSMLRDACRDILNVTVCDGSPYAVSRETFPTYFIKEADTATDTSILLDLDIFCRHIAPALGISLRFAGTEPTDALTARYNRHMETVLPRNGLEFKETERLCDDAAAISASRVRALLSRGQVIEALKLTPETSHPYILAHAAASALRRELELTPKPGLVDRDNNGAHSDMDFDIMMRSIEAIERGLADMARVPENPVETGLEIERAMFEATGGVNTHKGAIFAMSLILMAVTRLQRRGEEATPEALSRETALCAAAIPAHGEATHGSEVRRRHGVPGALENARSGYRDLFDRWLPFYRSQAENAPLLTLLKIMSEMDDTNVLHRAGSEGAEFVKLRSAQLLDDFSTDSLKRFDSECIQRNISPGGAADMLSLTFLIDSLTTK